MLNSESHTLQYIRHDPDVFLSLHQLELELELERTSNSGSPQYLWFSSFILEFSFPALDWFSISISVFDGGIYSQGEKEPGEICI